MTLGEVIQAVEARTSHRYDRSNDTMATLLRQHTGRPRGGPIGHHIGYDRGDVERAIVWLRMRECFGDARGDQTWPIRRAAQDAIPEAHAPGWVVMSEGGAWFQSSAPVGVLTSARGAAAVRVHDDCHCGEAP